MKKVLLADNDPVQLQEWSKEICKRGYAVVTASSVAEAQELLINGDLDLAIFDLHMESENDELDDSGLRLAQVYRESVPIIILTGRATVSAVVAALQKESRSSPAVAVVRKQQDGPKVLGQAIESALSKKVFVSHGHDDKARTAVARFLENRGLEAVMLKDQPVVGQAILAAFQECSNVQFAIILMTPDDEGRLKGDDTLLPRARQNVIFELGFLIAKLGQDRVVALCLDGARLDWPSNYRGVLYQELDPYGEWQEKICDIMKGLGIQLLS